MVVVPSALTSCGSFPNAASSPDFRYLAAVQMLSLSERNSFQCFFFCLRMASWYCFAAHRAVFSRCGTFRPTRRSERAWFRQYVYIWRSCVKSAVHHRFACGDGFAFGVKACTTSLTGVMSRSVFCCTVPPDGVALAIVALTSFHDAFFSRSSRSWFCRKRKGA